MARKWIWLTGVVVGVALAGLLVNTEGRYLQFIGSLDEVNIEVSWDRSARDGQKLVLTFGVNFHNTSSLTMWVEAINVTLYLDDDFAGAFTIQEGSFQVAPSQSRTIPLTATLWQARQQQLQAAQAAGKTLIMTGKTRVQFELGQSKLKSFYPLSQTFSLKNRLEGLF